MLLRGQGRVLDQDHGLSVATMKARPAIGALGSGAARW